MSVREQIAHIMFTLVGEKSNQMTNWKQIALTLLCLTIVSHSADAQLLDRVMRRTKNKIGNKVEDLIVEKASEAIAKKVYNSLSDGFDKMMADAYKQDSSYRANYGDSLAIKYGQVAGSWMARMNEAADIPESYEFDVTVNARSTFRKEVDEMTLFFSKSSGRFAFEQIEKNEKRLFVMDAENDVTILYLDDGKRKTAQAIPNMMALTGAMINVHTQEQIEQEFSFKEVKGKKIIGYNTQGYQAENEENITTMYVTDELDVSWSKAFLNTMKKFVVALHMEGGTDHPMHNGMVLASTYVDKKKPKDSHEWEVTSYEEKTMTIVNADYEFGSLTSME